MVCCTRSFAVGILHAPNRWVQLCCFLLYSLFEFQFRFPLLWTCTVLPLRCHNCHYCSTANTTASFAAAATAPCTAVATRLPFCCWCCSVAVVLVFFTFCTDFNSKQLLTSDWFWLVVFFLLFFLSTFLFFELCEFPKFTARLRLRLPNNLLPAFSFFVLFRFLFIFLFIYFCFARKGSNTIATSNRFHAFALLFSHFNFLCTSLKHIHTHTHINIRYVVGSKRLIIHSRTMALCWPS